MTNSDIGSKLNSMEVLSTTLLFFKLALGVVIVWIWGYIGFSVSWLFLCLLAYILNERYRRQKKLQMNIAREIATNEQTSILTRITDLPSWVFFPDFDRAEWVNKIIKQLWPYIADYVRNLLRTVIEPLVRKKLPEYLRSFKFVKTDLGNIAPRIGGVKVFAGNEVRRDEIILDVDIYYFGDADLSFGIRGITAGVKDLEVHGTLRISLRPLIPKIPLIGAVTVAFLNNPNINFDLTDFGNALDFPGLGRGMLSDLLRGVVREAVGHLLVLPNRLPIQLVKDLDVYKLRYPIPQGVLRIHVISAEELKRADIKLIGQGKSDPYCVVKLGSNVFKTKVIHNNIHPEWNETFEVIADQRSGQVLDVEVFDEDQGNKDDFLGRTEVDVESVSKTGSVDTTYWLHLEDVKSGSIHLRITWLNLSASPGAFTDAYAQAADEKETPDTHLHAGYLQVVLDSARNLPSVRRNDEPSPFAVVQLANEHMESKVQTGTANPTWEEAFSFLVSNPHVDSLTVTIKDKKSGHVIGYCQVPLKLLLSEPNMVVNRPFHLKESNPQATVHLRLTLRALAAKTQGQMSELLSADDEEDEEYDEEELTGLDRSPESEDVPSTTANNSSQLGANSNGLVNGSPLGAPSSPSRSDSTGGDVRRRTPAGGLGELEGGIYQYGRLQLTLRYSSHRMCLVVVVHKASHLIACDDDGSSDPYVKLMIIPKSMHTKKKTQVVKNSLNPTFDETFDLPITQADLSRSTLRLEMRNRLGRFSRGRKHMGFVEIALGCLDLSHAVTNWYAISSS